MEIDSVLRSSGWIKTFVLGTCLTLAGCIDSEVSNPMDGDPVAESPTVPAPPMAGQPPTMDPPPVNPPPVAGQPPSMDPPAMDPPPMAGQPPSMDPPAMDPPPMAGQPPSMDPPAMDPPPMAGQPPSMDPPSMDPPPMAGQPPSMEPPPAAAVPVTPPPGNDFADIPASDAEAARFLTQATFGPTMEGIEQLRNMDYAAWLDRQMDPEMTPPTLIIPHLQKQEEDASGDRVRDRHRREHYWFAKTLTADDQLRMRMAFALSQIFVVSANEFNQHSAYKHLADYYDTLSRGAFGSYRDLLEQVTLHPIMGMYLDHAGNAKADPENNIFPDQNFARESLQLFSIGVVELNPDGSPRLDGQGQEIETYDADLIAEFARVFTGWTFVDLGERNFHHTSFYSYEPMHCVPVHHDNEPKELFNGQIVAAASDCQATLDQALDILAAHPNVAPFMSKQLIQRLVTSNPSPQYVHRVSSVWTNTDGDLGEVLKAILLDGEARTLSNDPHFGKVREPIVKLAAFMRAVGVHIVPYDRFGYSFHRDDWNFRQSFGQDMLSAPSVFNFYSPDHQPLGYFRDNGLVAPELQLLDEARVLSSYQGMDRMYRAFVDGMPDGHGRAYLDLRELQAMADADDFEGIVERINLLLFSGNLEMNTQNLLLDLFREMEQDSDIRHGVAEAYRFVFFIPEFDIQR